GRDSDDLAAAEDVVGKSCASVDADNLVTVGILKGIVGFKTADKDPSDLNNALDQSPSRISASGGGQQVSSEMTPRDVFKDLCGIIFTGESRNVFARRKTLFVRAEFVSSSRSPNAIV
ncbi:hypothetical protein TNCV_800841, partial [Trichonephila clavipes]